MESKGVSETKEDILFLILKMNTDRLYLKCSVLPAAKPPEGMRKSQILREEVKEGRIEGCVSTSYLELPGGKSDHKSEGDVSQV